MEWQKWKDFDGELTKVIEEGSIQDLGKYLVSMRKEFFNHFYIKREQVLAYPLQEEQVGPQSSDFFIALLQIDFA